MIPKVHPSFRLNGRSLDHNAIMTVAYSYVKEGEKWEKAVGDFLLNWLDDFEVLTVHTSGSTGKPKAYKIKKEYFLQSAQLTHDFFEMQPTKEALCCLPLDYIAGKMMMIRAIAHGWHLDIVPPSSTPLQKLKKRYDFSAMTAYQVTHSLPDIHKVRTLLVGGGPVHSQLIEDLKGKHTYAYHTYGMTETCSHVAVRQLHPHYEPTFKAVPGTHFALSERQTLIINAPHLGANDLETNDIVLLHDEHHFELLGRTDDVINTGGVKIFTPDIENLLSSNIKSRYFITKMHHDSLGEQVVLVVEGDKKAIDLEHLDSYQTPKQVFFTPLFIETHTGKVDKKATLERVKKVQ